MEKLGGLVVFYLVGLFCCVAYDMFLSGEDVRPLESFPKTLLRWALWFIVLPKAVYSFIKDKLSK